MNTRKLMPAATKAAGEERRREAERSRERRLVQDEGRRGQPGAVF